MNHVAAVRSIAANRRALAAHGALVEMCACGGQILAIADERGVLEAVQRHQAEMVHSTWRARWFLKPDERVVRLRLYKRDWMRIVRARKGEAA